MLVALHGLELWLVVEGCEWMVWRKGFYLKNSFASTLLSPAAGYALPVVFRVLEALGARRAFSAGKTRNIIGFLYSYRLTHVGVLGGIRLQQQ